MELTVSPTESWIDKERLKRSFSRQAPVYDQNARLQRQVGYELLENLRQRHITGRRIIDIGMGTAWLTRQLACIYPEAFIVGFDLAWGMVNFADGYFRCRFLQADAERLPFKKESFDLAVANLVYQWVNGLEAAFSQLAAVLIPGGRFMFTTLGPRTLSELHIAYLKAHQKLGIDFYPHGQRFVSTEEIISILRRTGWSKIDIQIKRNRQLFSSVIDLARALKSIGASNAQSHCPAGLGGRLLFQQMSEYYQQYYTCQDGIYATFEIFTVEALKDNHTLRPD